MTSSKERSLLGKRKYFDDEEEPSCTRFHNTQEGMKQNDYVKPDDAASKDTCNKACSGHADNAEQCNNSVHVTHPDVAVNNPTASDSNTEDYWESMAEKITQGDRVSRGIDWDDGDEDGGPGALGTVVDMRYEYTNFYDEHVDMCEVRWDNGHTGQYWVDGYNGYELEIVQ